MAITQKNDPNYIKDFLGYLKSVKGLSPNTIQSYYYDLKSFLNFVAIRLEILDENDEYYYTAVTVDDIKKLQINDLYAFISYADEDLDNTNYGKYRKAAVVHALYAYLMKVNLIDNNVANELEMPKIDQRLPIYLSLNQCETLLNTIMKNENNEMRNRDYAIIMLFLNCGLRISELTSLNLDSINEDRYINVVGKGNKERQIYLNDATFSAIKDYIELRPKDVKESEKHALFISQKKVRMSNRAVQYMFDKYLLEAGLDKNKFTVHKLRHTAATLMYKYGSVDIRSLQEILGHTSVATTQIYTHLDNSTLKKSIENNPLANRKKY